MFAFAASGFVQFGFVFPVLFDLLPYVVRRFRASFRLPSGIADQKPNHRIERPVAQITQSTMFGFPLWPSIRFTGKKAAKMKVNFSTSHVRSFLRPDRISTKKLTTLL